MVVKFYLTNFKNLKIKTLNDIKFEVNIMFSKIDFASQNMDWK